MTGPDISRGEREEMRIYVFRLIYDLTNNKHVKQKLVSSDVDQRIRLVDEKN